MPNGRSDAARAPSLAALGRRLPLDRLARRAAGGDASAFGQIYERFHQELYRYCLAIVRDRDEAEDALQATMAAALRALPGEERRIALRPWLYRIAHNESISVLRRRDPAGELVEEPAASGGSPLQEIERRDRLRLLVADLNALPDRQRAAIVMRELSGLSYEEIGEALASSGQAARQTVYEARIALRTREEGRDMSCEEVRLALSERDGRRLRGRRLRAHLGSCDACLAFRESIARRQADLRSLCPPLPAAAAAGVLASLGGGTGAGAGAGGAIAGGAGVAGAGLAGSAALKGASLAAAVAVAAGAADLGGVIDLPNPMGGGERNGRAGSPSPAGGGSSETGEARTGGGVTELRGEGAGGASASGAGHGSGATGEDGEVAAGGPEGANAGGAADPGRSGSAPGGTDVEPGQSDEAPGHTGSPPEKDNSKPAEPPAGSKSQGGSAAAGGNPVKPIKEPKPPKPPKQPKPPKEPKPPRVSEGGTKSQGSGGGKPLDGDLEP